MISIAWWSIAYIFKLIILLFFYCCVVTTFSFIITVTDNGCDNKIMCQSFSCRQRSRRVLAYHLDPEDFYTTYKSSHQCGASRIFECFSMPFGSPGTPSVRDQFRQASSKFRVLSSCHVSADSAENLNRKLWHRC